MVNFYYVNGFPEAGSISIAYNQIKEQTTLSFVANLFVIHKRAYKQEAIMGLQSTRHTE